METNETLITKKVSQNCLSKKPCVVLPIAAIGTGHFEKR